jgi:cell division protein FtsI (penicillin-binding protein 3)
MLPRTRSWLVWGGLALWAVVVWLRLAQIQVLEHQEWEAESMRQREKTVEVAGARGDIRSRDGRLLAGSLERVSVYANPRKIPVARRGAIADRLAPIVGMSREQIARELAAHDGFFYLAKDLDPYVAAEVSTLRQRGVGTLGSERRVYPHGMLAGPTIGFVDAEGVGRAGLEAFYDRTLRGTPSVYRAIRDGKTSPTPLDLRLERQGRPGQSLWLSIDSRVQQLVEEELARTITEIGARGASAVVMEVSTGELLGLASIPSYDPGRIGQTPAEHWRNRAVEDAIEPGSTFKTVIVAAALSARVLSPWEAIDCSGGGIQVAGIFIRDHGRYGVLPVREMLAKSSNTGLVRVALRLGDGQLDEMIRTLGFGELSRVELPAEARGLYRGPKHWSGVSKASLAIGQEISVTALQLAQAYAAIANGGLLVSPVLVRETREPDDTPVAPYRPRTGVRVLDRDVALTLSTLLQGVVEEGTGKSAEVPGYGVAGKTGTAQKATGGGYGAGRHAAWFAGFFPVPNPRLAIVICVDEPESTFWAAEVAAPTFGRLARRLAIVLGIPPDSGVRT